LPKVELHDLYYSPNAVGGDQIKADAMNVHVACMRMKRNALRDLVEKPEG